MSSSAPTYPATPVDCLISELRDMFGINGRAYLTKSDFEARVAQFNAEVAEDVARDKTFASKIDRYVAGMTCKRCGQYGDGCDCEREPVTPNSGFGI